jgi:hypothetical protein
MRELREFVRERGGAGGEPGRTRREVKGLEGELGEITAPGGVEEEMRALERIPGAILVLDRSRGEMGIGGGLVGIVERLDGGREVVAETRGMSDGRRGGGGVVAGVEGTLDGEGGLAGAVGRSKGEVEGGEEWPGKKSSAGRGRDERLGRGEVGGEDSLLSSGERDGDWGGDKGEEGEGEDCLPAESIEKRRFSHDVRRGSVEGRRDRGGCGVKSGRWEEDREGVEVGIAVGALSLMQRSESVEEMRGRSRAGEDELDELDEEREEVKDEMSDEEGTAIGVGARILTGLETGDWGGMETGGGNSSGRVAISSTVARRQATSTCPPLSYENLILFPIRFTSTCRSLAASPTMTRGTSTSTMWTSSTFLVDARGKRISHTSSTTVRIENGSDCSFTCLVSLRLKSKMSLITVRSTSVDRRMVVT